MEDSGKKIPDQLAGGKGEMINLELETQVTGKSLPGRLGFQVEFLVCLGSMRDHGLAAEGAVEAAWDPTEHRHPEVQPDVVVQCLVTLRVIFAERAETAVYLDRISTPINSDVLCGGDPAHGHLRHQVMQSNVLVIPKFPVSLVHDLTITFLYDLDEIFGFYNWGTSGKHSGRGIGV